MVPWVTGPGLPGLNYFGIYATIIIPVPDKRSGNVAFLSIDEALRKNMRCFCEFGISRLL